MFSTSLSLGQEEQKISIFAAISSRPVLDPLLAQFRSATGIIPQVSYGSSAVLAKQIEKGARVDLFLSADQEWVDYLQQQKLITSGNIANFLTNQLAVVTHQQEQLKKFNNQAELKSFLSQTKRLVIADPHSVPLGRYSWQVINNLDLTSSISGNLVYGLDAQAVVRFIERGEVTVGIVYFSDIIHTPSLKVLFVLPSTLHQQIIYPLALMGQKPSAAATRLFNFLLSSQHHPFIKQQGFNHP